MRTFISYLILALLSVRAFSQDRELSGTWYSAQQDFIDFNPRGWTMESGRTLWEKTFTICKREGRNIRFLTEYYDSRDSNKIKTDFDDHFDFVIKEQADDHLILAPVSKLSLEFFNNRKEIQFYRQSSFTDTTIRFEKLVFRSTECFGTCPVLDIELHNDGKINYRGRYYDDTALTGNFSGTMAGPDMDTLIQLLQHCQLPTLHWRTVYCCDAPMITLIIYFNGIRKYFKSRFPPRITNELISFLYKLNSKALLTRIKRSVEFEE